MSCLPVLLMGRKWASRFVSSRPLAPEAGEGIRAWFYGLKGRAGGEMSRLVTARTHIFCRRNRHLKGLAYRNAAIIPRGANNVEDFSSPAFCICIKHGYRCGVASELSNNLVCGFP